MGQQILTIEQEGQKLRTFIRQIIKESIGEEIMKLRAAFLPYVKEKEQKEIEEMYGKPSRKAVKSYDLEI